MSMHSINHENINVTCNILKDSILIEQSCLISRLVTYNTYKSVSDGARLRFFNSVKHFEKILRILRFIHHIFPLYSKTRHAMDPLLPGLLHMLIDLITALPHPQPVSHLHAIQTALDAGLEQRVQRRDIALSFKIRSKQLQHDGVLHRGALAASQLDEAVRVARATNLASEAEIDAVLAADGAQSILHRGGLVGPEALLEAFQHRHARFRSRRVQVEG